MPPAAELTDPVDHGSLPTPVVAELAIELGLQFSDHPRPVEPGLGRDLGQVLDLLGPAGESRMIPDAGLLQPARELGDLVRLGLVEPFDDPGQESVAIV